MKALLKKGSKVVLLLVCLVVLFAPISVHAGEEDIPRTFNMAQPIAPGVFIQ